MNLLLNRPASSMFWSSLMASAIATGLLCTSATPIRAQQVRPIRSFSQSRDARAIAFSPDGNTLVYEGMSPTDGNTSIWLCDWRTGRKLRSLFLAPDDSNPLRISPNGRQMARGTMDGMKFYDFPTCRLKWTALLDRNYDTGLPAFSPDGRLLASGGGNTPGRELFGVRDIKTKRVLWKTVGQSPCAWLGNKTLFLWSSTRGRLQQWDFPKRRLVREWPIKGFIKTMQSARNKIIFSDDEGVKVLSLSSNRIHFQRPAQPYAEEISASPDGRFLLLYSRPGAELISLETGKTLWRQNARHSVVVAFAPDSHTFAVAKERSVSLWRVQ